MPFCLQELACVLQGPCHCASGKTSGCRCAYQLTIRFHLAVQFLAKASGENTADGHSGQTAVQKTRSEASHRVTENGIAPPKGVHPIP